MEICINCVYINDSAIQRLKRPKDSGKQRPHPKWKACSSFAGFEYFSVSVFVFCRLWVCCN